MSPSSVAGPADAEVDNSSRVTAGGSSSASQAQERARLVATLHRLTWAEFQALISPAQQRALLQRYMGLSEESKRGGLRRAKRELEGAAEELSRKRQADRFSVSTDIEALEARLQDHAWTLRQLEAEVVSVEERQEADRARKSATMPKPYLSHLFTRELERARVSAGSGGSGAVGGIASLSATAVAVSPTSMGTIAD